MRKYKALMLGLFMLQSGALALECGLLWANGAEKMGGFFVGATVFVFAMWIYTLWTLFKVMSYND